MPLTGELNSYAREKLKGAWGIALAVCLIAMLLGGIEGGINYNFAEGTSLDFSMGSARSVTVPWYMIWALSIPTLLSIYNFAVFLIGGAVELGACTFFCRTALGERPPVSALFDRFEIFFKAFGLRLFMGLFIFLWALLLIVPGIIAAYRYAMAPYFMAEYPQMGIREAVNRSKEVMRERKGKLFLLQLSIMVWPLLIGIGLGIVDLIANMSAFSIVLAGIAFLAFLPYLHTAEATFYLTLTGRLFQAAPVESAELDPGEPVPEAAETTETL